MRTRGLKYTLHKLNQSNMATFAGDDNVEPRYMKRRVKAGIIEADFDLRALIVHYEVEATGWGSWRSDASRKVSH